MAVDHTIRKNGNGETKEVKLTFRSSIRAFCLECMGWSPEKVKHCTSPTCPLYPFRLGYDPTKKGKGQGRSAEDMAKVRQNIQMDP
jgi:hypothetical protein